MSFYFRDKPRFGERFRGKSGDKLLQEIQQQLDEDSKSFFEPTTNNSLISNHKKIISKLLEHLGFERAIRGISSSPQAFGNKQFISGPLSLGTGRFRKRSEMILASGRRTFEPRGCNSDE
ncbi:hypothetical protein HZH68_007299 [Vespula germanica]|uniref:Uncharacterized protein n=1 Tax=Vespula germanica TaxID=30212 RepID=A0A834NAZ2_VESGE|nr:hypothetical protein HZH68_007299 [Vespula germanica]